MGIKIQLQALKDQRDELAKTASFLGGSLPEDPTFQEINDALKMLERSFAPAYAAVYTDWGGEYVLVFGRLAYDESIPSKHPSELTEGTNLSLYSSYRDFEDIQPATASDVPWASDAASITSVVFLEGVYPDSTAYWFNNMGSLSKFTGLDKIGMPVESTAHMFADCEYVSELDLSWLNTKNASDMTGMFDGMTRLERITIGQNFSFTGDGSTTCSLPNGDWQAASSGAIYEASDVPGGLVDTYVKQPSAYAAVYTDHDGEYALVFGKSCIVPSMYTAADGGLFFFVSGASWTGIEKNAFTSSSEVPWLSGYASSITRAAVVDELSPVSTALWFYDMANCASADLGLLDVSKAKSMRGMFYGCSSLADVGDLSGWQTGSCEDMSYLFQSCSALTSIGSLDGWEVSQIQNFAGTFANCASLTSVGDLSNWQTGACESMEAMFYNCFKLSTLGDLSGWDVSNVSSFAYAFGGHGDTMKFATLGDISGWSTGSATNMASMFQNCSSLSANCSTWNVDGVTSYDYFNTNSPGVTEPSRFTGGTGVV